MKFVAFFNFAAFSILLKNVWQNSRHFYIHCKIDGVFIPGICSIVHGNFPKN